MSHATLIRPPAIFSKTAYTSVITMPLATAYLSAYLKKNGHAVTPIDSIGEGLNHISESYTPSILYRGLSDHEIIARIPSHTDWIGVSAMFSQDWPHIASLLQKINEAFPSIPILVGGEHATAMPEYILESSPSVFGVVKGEGEEVSKQFAEFVDGKRTLSEVQGLIHRTNIADLSSVKRPSLNLHQVPWPAWDLFDLNPYFQQAEQFLGLGVYRGREMPLLATRGCPYQCTFCSSPEMWTTKYRTRPPKDVVDEIVSYIDRYKISNIQFFDLTAIIQKRWIHEFCDELLNRNVKLHWQLPNGTRSEALDESVLSKMKAAGCSNLCYAPESGSKKTLRQIKKHISLERMEQSIATAKQLSFYVKCNIIIGFPDESRLDIFRTLYFLIKMAWRGLDETNIFLFSPYPGTELFEDLKKEGKIRAIDRSYFESLMCFLDMKIPSIYCKRVGPKELWVYRTFGIFGFYFLTYLFHPKRIFRGFVNFFKKTPYTKWETKVFQIIRSSLPFRTVTKLWPALS